MKMAEMAERYGQNGWKVLKDSFKKLNWKNVRRSKTGS